MFTSQTSNALIATGLAIPRVCCFELVGYLECWDHDYDQQKKDSKKTSTTAITKIKTKENVAKKASILLAAMDNGGKVSNIYTSISNSE